MSLKIADDRPGARGERQEGGKHMGLSARLRMWMKGQSGKFTTQQLYEGLGLPAGKERERARNALTEFIVRGEVGAYSNTPLGNLTKSATFFIYNRSYQVNERNHEIGKKIYKAMYVLGNFGVSDLERMADYHDVSYLYRLANRLVKSGLLSLARTQRCTHSRGREKVFSIVNRDKFRVAVVK